METPSASEAVTADVPRDEEALVAAAMRGDAAAIDAIWQRHRRWIAAVLLAHKPVFEDLDDLLQEVAMTLVAKVSTLRDEANVRAWLRTVAINAARAAGRSGKYRPRPAAPDAIIDVAGADDDRRADDRLTELLQRLERLPEGYREPLLLRVSHGLRSKQIAEILGVPPATIDTRIARARRMLRETPPAANDAGTLPFPPRLAAMRRGDEAI